MWIFGIIEAHHAVMRKITPWIPLCCCIFLVMRGVYALENEVHNSYELHDDDHGHEHGTNHHGEDVFDELYKELNGTDNVLTIDNLETLYVKLHLKSCLPDKQIGCNTVSSILILDLRWTRLEEQ